MNGDGDFTILSIAEFVQFLAFESENVLVGPISGLTHQKRDIRGFRRRILIQLHQRVVVLKFFGIPDGTNIDIALDHQTSIVLQIIFQDILAFQEIGAG